MASISAIGQRRLQVITRLLELPGAIVNPEASAGDHKGQIGLKTSVVNPTAHNLLLASTELLEFLDHVLTPLVARVEALEAIQSSTAKSGKGK